MHADQETTAGHVRFDDAGLEQSICDRFEAQVGKFADRAAVVTAQRQFTYRELNAAANRIARAIRSAGAGEGACVAILLEQGALVVAAILGVLKSAHVYMRLDPALPAQRSAYMLADSGAGLIVTSLAHLAQARLLAGSGRRVLCCDDLDPALDASNLALPIDPPAPALVLYTSGSTGRPKGVLHSHRNVLLEARNYNNDALLSPRDRLSLCTSLSFAMAVRNLYGALLTGASLYPYDLVALGFGPMARWAREFAISILYMPPTAFRSFCQGLEPDDRFPAIRILRIGGEPMSGEDVTRYRHHFRPDCRLFHSLGPTEALTVSRQWIELGSCEIVGKLPIGSALPDKEVVIVDDDGRACPPGEVGEIVVRSKYLALGYWRRPDLTNAHFREEPGGAGYRRYHTGDLGAIRPDGSLMHLGRRDTQVKIRGYRIELDEIEAALLRLPGVQSAIVDARARADGEKSLVAYVVLQPGARATPGTLRSGLEAALPGYMIPASYMWMDALPTLPNGKVDRGALPQPYPSRPALGVAFEACATPTQGQLARIWSEVLMLAEIGANDPYVELGGDSLQATRILARVKQVFALELPLRELFEAPTVAALAARIDQLRGSSTAA